MSVNNVHNHQEAPKQILTAHLRSVFILNGECSLNRYDVGLDDIKFSFDLLEQRIDICEVWILLMLIGFGGRRWGGSCCGR